MLEEENKPKHPGGRPTLYGKEILDKTDEYLWSCGHSYEVLQRPKIDNGIHKGEEDFRKEVIKVPTIEGLAVHLGISKETIYAWEKEEEKKEFSDVICKLRGLQADMLINKGLSGEYNSTIAKVLLTKHGYREGIETTGNEGTPLNQNIADAIGKVYGDRPESIK